MRQHNVSFFALTMPNFVVRALLLLSCDLFFTLTTGRCEMGVLLDSVFFSLFSFFLSVSLFWFLSLEFFFLFMLKNLKEVLHGGHLFFLTLVDYPRT